MKKIQPFHQKTKISFRYKIFVIFYSFRKKAQNSLNILRINHIFINSYEKIPRKLADFMTDFRKTFMKYENFKMKKEVKLARKAFHALKIYQNEKPTVLLEKTVFDFCSKKDYIQKVKIFNAISKLANAHKKWIQAVQKELLKFKKM